MTWADIPWDLVATVAFRLVVLAVIVFVVIRLSTRRPRPTRAAWPAPDGWRTCEGPCGRTLFVGEVAGGPAGPYVCERCRHEG